MSKTIFKYVAVIMTVIFVLVSAVSVVATATTLRTQQERIVDYALDITAENIANTGMTIPTFFDSQVIQIAVMDRQGNIIAYNGEASPIDQSKSGEYIEAYFYGTGKEIYYSEDFETNVLAVTKTTGDYVVRVVVAYLGFGQIVARNAYPLAVAYVMVIAISYFGSIILSRRMIKPINEVSSYLEDILLDGDSGHSGDINVSYDEYNIILGKARRISRRINTTMKRLRFEQFRINAILDQMKEGFVLLNEKNQVIMANKRARIINSAAFVYKQDATEFFFDKKLLKAIKNVQDETIKFDYISIDRIYSCYISKVEYGVTVLFINVTENRKAMQMRSEFFSNVSHELKTPMTAIRGYSDILLADYIKDPEAIREVYRKINRETVNMSNLISDILMISMLENNAIEVQYTDIKIESIINDVLDSQSKVISDKNLEIVMNCEDIVYHANIKHIHQLFNNLISNACKYNRDGGQVTIDVFKYQNSVNIIVGDTGNGIAANEIPRIFERFYRIDDGRDKGTGGTGLGLSIVKHIVAHYKGLVTVDSVIGQGSKFVVVLPIAKKEAE